MPSRAVYTPIPRNQAMRRNAFEYIALVRIEVESSFMHINPALDVSAAKTAIMTKCSWMKVVSWPPPVANPERVLVITALTKVRAYLDRMTRTQDDIADNMAIARAARYGQVYGIYRTNPQKAQRIAVFRVTVAINEDGETSWEHRMAADGDLPPGLDDFVVPQGRADELSIFLQSAVRLDLQRKIELISI